MGILFDKHSTYCFHAILIFTESQPDKKPQAILKPDQFAAWTCIIMFFMYFWNFVVMET